MVEVCAICDIAGCHHIRSRAAMTDPTPTRAEVEHHPRPDVTDLTVQEWAAYRCDDAGAVARKLLAENQALRERAEAAERAHLSLCEAIGIPATALSHIEYTAQLTAARRAEAAAWNDAIEAAAVAAEEWDTFGPTVRAIRALRRAAPTEDRS